MILTLYRCNRCADTFHRKEGSKTDRLTQQFSELNEPDITIHLCHDCTSSYESWFAYDFEHDALNDKLAEIASLTKPPKSVRIPIKKVD